MIQCSKGFKQVFLFSIVMACVAISGSAAARSSSSVTKAPKGLSKSQATSLFKKLIHRAVKDPFLSEQALPRKCVLAKIAVDVEHSDVSDRQVTNMVLNELLETGKFMILNQEMEFEDHTSLDVVLNHYDSAGIAGRRGLSLGSQFVVSGRISAVSLVTGSGKLKQGYEGVFVVDDIRSGKRVLSLASSDQPIKQSRAGRRVRQ